MSNAQLNFLKDESQKRPVVYVLGNHEFYHKQFDEILEFWQYLREPNLHILENSTAIFDNPNSSSPFKKIRVIGATLWSSMNEEDPKVIKEVTEKINDYILINKGKRILTPQDTIERFYKSYSFIKDELSTKFDGATIVVTHFLPSLKSVEPRSLEFITRHAYHSDLERLITATQPNIWVHGHAHCSWDYYIEKTRVICNPRGYPGIQENPNFNPNLTIDI
jgi:Icc-related predicted phosphoesterase